MTCNRCGNECTVLINGRGTCCNPFRACRKCVPGTYESKPTPNWMNRLKCDKCGHQRSH